MTNTISTASSTANNSSNSDSTTTSSSSARLVLRRASRDQTIASRKRHFLSWGLFMTQDQYLQREVLLSESQPTTAHGGYTCWALVPADDPDTLDMLCTCETIRRRAMVAVPSKDTDGETDIVDGWANNLMSVFCPPEKRRNGYASTMLRLLQDELRSQDGVVGSVLCSEVGASYYERFGWNSLPVWRTHVRFALGDGAAIDAGGDVRLLEDADVAAVSARDCELLVDEVRRSTKQRAQFLLYPDAANYPWHWARYRYYAQLNGQPAMKHVGAAARDESDGSAIIWTHNPTERQMFVLRLRHGGAGSLAKLLRAAMADAAQYGLAEIVFWADSAAGVPEMDSAVQLVQAELGSELGSAASIAVETKPYEGNVPGLALYHGDLFGTREFDWISNERHGWL